MYPKNDFGIVEIFMNFVGFGERLVYTRSFLELFNPFDGFSVDGHDILPAVIYMYMKRNV